MQDLLYILYTGGENLKETILSQGCGGFPLPKGGFPAIQWLFHLCDLPKKHRLAAQLNSYLHKMSAPGSQTFCLLACNQHVATSLEQGRGMGDHIHFELGSL